GAVVDVVVARASVTPSPFGPPVMVNDNKLNVQASPVILSMIGHRLFVAWQDSRSGNYDIYTSLSLDNATTFAPNNKADDSIGTSEQIEPSGSVLANGTVLFVWQDNRRSKFDFDIYFAKSTDGGHTFAKNVKVDDSASSEISWQERPSVAVTTNGTIYVAWTDDRTGHQRVRGAFSTDGGNTFSPSQEIAPAKPSSGQTGVALASDGERIYAAFMDNVSGIPHPYLSVSTDGGRSFSSPLRLDNAGGSATVQRDISLAWLPVGGVVAVWEDSRDGNWDIYASVVSADGTIVVSDLRVDDDTTGAYQTNPCVAADRAGTIYVVWEDERNSLFAVRFAYLKVGSRSFTPSIEVATPKADDFQRKASIVSPEPGRVFVVWQDDRTGSYDVYASAGHFPNLFDISLAPGFNFISVPLSGWEYRASTLGLMTGDMVVSWNSATGTYDKIYIVGISPSTADFTICESTGYWVYATASETLRLNGTVPDTTQTRSITVPSGGGWVAVGFQSLSTTMRASDIPGMYSGGSIQTVSAFDPVSQTYKTYISGLPSTDFLLSPGVGLWLWCTASGTLTYTA
ncbi:MAG: sialidase family protein, partial [Thermoplasmata archaeon]